MKPLLELLKDFYIERIILYAVITFFSFFVIVPLGDLKIRFTDHQCSQCILYSKVTYRYNSSNSQCVGIEFGRQEVCQYSIAVSSVFCLIYPLVVGLIYYVMLRRDSAETRDENKLDLAQPLFLIHIATEVAVVILMLVSACLVTHGFRQLCDSMTSENGGLGSCRAVEKLTFWCGYDGSNFYVALSVAVAGSWFLFTSWLLQGILGVWKLWRLNMLPVLSICRRG